MSEFDWYGDRSVVVREQLSVAVYVNPNGQMVIRQQCPWERDDDSIIIVNPESAQAVADRLTALAAIEMPMLALPAPKAKSGAERTRAYRDRKRDAGVTDSVTENVTERH